MRMLPTLRLVLLCSLILMLFSPAHACWYGGGYGGFGGYGGYASIGSLGNGYLSTLDGCGPIAAYRHAVQADGGEVGDVVQEEEPLGLVPSDDIPDAPEGEPVLEIPTPEPNANNARDDARIVVNVPSDAQVFINNRQTTSTGSSRRFVTRDLLTRADYPYEVKMVMTHNDQLLELTKLVQLRGGDIKTMSFDLPKTSLVRLEDSTDRIETKLIVHVPEDARVTLYGEETTVTGAVREYITKDLHLGETWSDYPIEIHIPRDGQTFTAKKIVSIRAGETKTVKFDVDRITVAKSTQPQVR